VVFSFLMRDRYEPHNEPAPWSPFPPDRAVDPYTDHRSGWDETPDAARSAGLRRLSRLTWRATQLGAIATVGFATLFARTAPAQTVSSQPAPAPTVKAASAAPSPSPAKTHHKRHHRHHHRPRPTAAPAPAPGSGGGSTAPAPAPAPPTTAPAPPPPSPSPSHTSSGGSHGGG